jgi:hypothetical protein
MKRYIMIFSEVIFVFRNISKYANDALTVSQKDVHGDEGGAKKTCQKMIMNKYSAFALFLNSSRSHEYTYNIYFPSISYMSKTLVHAAVMR